MNLRQIEVFSRIMTTGSLSEAARSLGLSQPAASRILRHTEDQLGFALFKRVRGRLAPTAEARGLHRSAARLHDALATLDQVMTSLREGREGHLRLVVTPALGLGLLPQTVGEFRHLYPDVSLDLVVCSSQAITQALLNGECEVGFGLTSPDVAGLSAPGLEQHKVGEVDMVCLCGRDSPLAALDRVGWDDLVGQPFIGIATDGPIGMIFANALERAGIALRPQVTVETLFLACRLVEYGGGATLVDPFTAADADPERTCVRPMAASVSCAVTVQTAEDTPLSLMAQRFIDLFCRRLGGHLAETPP